MAFQNLLSVADLSGPEILELIELARKMKAAPGEYHNAIPRKAGALVFEKPSLRTRVSFEVALGSMGGYGIYLAPGDIGLGKRESIEDIAHTLERMVDVVIARVFSQETVVKLAAATKIPVVNALSDKEHPCQALADYMTIHEQFGDCRKAKLCYIGDGNNVAVSLLLTAAAVGAEIAVCTPSGYEPPREDFMKAREIGAKTGARLTVTYDLDKALSGADAVYTDVWVSMGQEGTAGSKAVHFQNHKVTPELMAKTGKKQTVFMHCLPAHRNEEVAPGVIDGPQSIIFNQAENRMHMQKAILHRMMAGVRH